MSTNNQDFILKICKIWCKYGSTLKLEIRHKNTLKLEIRHRSSLKLQRFESILKFRILYGSTLNL